MSEARLLLIRHGEPVGHEGRCIGHTDTALSSGGVREIESLGLNARVAPKRVVTSDLRRATDSGLTLARMWAAPCQSDARLRELSFGDWDGRRWDEIRAIDREALDRWGTDWVRIAPPGGESGEMLARRARAALDDAIATAVRDGSTIAIVSHAGWIRVAATILLGEPLEAAFDRSIGYARAAVVCVGDNQPVLRAWDVATLDDASVAR